MSYQRLRDLAAGLIRGNFVDGDVAEWNALREEARCAVDELDRMRKALKDAPHTDECDSQHAYCGSCGVPAYICRCHSHYIDELYEYRPCNCWKSRALNPEQPK